MQLVKNLFKNLEYKWMNLDIILNILDFKNILSKNKMSLDMKH
jgi:hypothetical protein